MAAHALHVQSDALLVLLEFEKPGLECVVSSGFFFERRGLGKALLVEVLEPGGEVIVGRVQGFDAGFGGLELVEVGIDGGGLRLAEADEVDDIGEDFDQTGVYGLGKVGESEVSDAALFRHLLSACFMKSLVVPV